MNDSVKVARIQANAQSEAHLMELAKSPLVQALLVWIVVEYLQRYHKFGAITGTVLEGGTMVKLLAPEFKASTDNIAAIAKAVAPMLPALAAAA